ncbi:N-acetyltransferase family protein [Erythrobacter sp. NE805]|uniref:GNAT family N-acetyltransferase n=1 Tax=Erythrobacter sp. NE805 TaxID=3389875 RepID=UPI00396B1B3F
MILRPATPADAAPLAKLGADSFVAAFGHLYRPEDLAAFLAEVHDPAAVLAEIEGADCTHRLVEHDGTLVAFCKLRHPTKFGEHTDAARPIELAQLYALPGHTGAGIGAQLMDWALATTRAGGHDAVLLSVYAENFGAQRFYQRYGFAKIADITFKVGNHLDPEYLYELKL